MIYVTHKTYLENFKAITTYWKLCETTETSNTTNFVLIIFVIFVIVNFLIYISLIATTTIDFVPIKYSICNTGKCIFISVMIRLLNYFHFKIRLQNMHSASPFTYSVDYLIAHLVNTAFYHIIAEVKLMC